MNNAVASNMEKQVRQEMANTILPSMYCITDWAAYQHTVLSMLKYTHKSVSTFIGFILFWRICSKLILGTFECQNTPVCMWSWSYFRCYKDIGACEGTNAPGNRPEIDSYWLHYQGQHREDGQVQGRELIYETSNISQRRKWSSSYLKNVL